MACDDFIAECLNVIANGGKIQVHLLLHLLHLLLELLGLLLHLLLELLGLLPHLLLELLGLLLYLLPDLLEFPEHLLLELLLLPRLLLYVLLELLHLLHKSIALSKRRKIGKISQLGGSLLESLCEEREIRLWAELRSWLWAELRNRLRRINVCHGFGIVGIWLWQK